MGKRNFWSDEEDAKLLAMYRPPSNMEVSMIAQKLNRPKGSISSRLYMLNEPRRPSIPEHKTHVRKSKQALQDLPPSRVGRIEYPRPGVLVHYAKE